MTTEQDTADLLNRRIAQHAPRRDWYTRQLANKTAAHSDRDFWFWQHGYEAGVVGLLTDLARDLHIAHLIIPQQEA